MENNKDLRYALLQATRYDVDHAKKCYDFVVGEKQVEPTAKRPDGIYYILNTPEGRVAKEYRTQLSDTEREQCIGIGVQRRGVSFCVALYEHDDVELLPDNKKAGKRARYLSREYDAIHDYNSEVNTSLLIEDNPALGEIVGDGWYIPALGVLEEIAWLRDEINQALKEVDGDPLTDKVYWSSTECSATLAWIVNFSYGYANYGYKYYGLAVRAVAAF